MLDLSLEDAASLVYHNIIHVNPAHEFRGLNLEPKDNKVDYGVFLAPPPLSTLGRAVCHFLRFERHRPKNHRLGQLNTLQNYKTDRPLAIFIKTKCGRDSDGYTPNQLAD
ncbi:hypothetical protein HD806DRAFT_235149 [Xylariaceae sp. AK1471]|nr:hypothetical protein HD806DRAFT_235149 [Xylariaceae sp. AK1471]